jgi:mRNA-degrading endonuclease RelE of RelBE toxin-antitoxin system
MIKYQIKFKFSAAKELKSLPSNVKQRIAKVLEKLTENPRIFGVIKLQGDNKFIFILAIMPVY